MLADIYNSRKQNSSSRTDRDFFELLEKSEKYQDRCLEFFEHQIRPDHLKKILFINDKTAEWINTSSDKLEKCLQTDDCSEILKFGVKRDLNLLDFCREINNNEDLKELQVIFSELCKIINGEISNIYSYKRIFNI